MSSKKQLRRKRKEQRAAQRQKKKGINPATAFILLTLGVILIAVVVASLRGPGATRPPAPRPGAVWSPEHGHWH